jgi:imidazoleglycerol-phosphate dehydratase
MPRTAEIERKTKETRIQIRIDLDGRGESKIETGIGFFDHMLESFSRHSLIDLSIKADGDRHVDDHHTVEDVGIALGQAIQKALGDKTGITRFGWAYCPLDEALARAVIDLSGRPHCTFNAPIHLRKIGDFQTETVPEFFKAVASSGMTIHLDLERGTNLHHAVEAMFKAFARALGQAVAVNPRETAVPSAKGVL